MIIKNRSHDEFVTFLFNHFKNDDSAFVNLFSDLIIWISLIDLSEVTSLLKHRYSSNGRGRKPRNPADMLRSLLLMHKLQCTNFDDWVDLLRKVPTYAILSGFDPKSTPGVGTFYDFTKRLWLSSSPHISHCHKRQLKKPKKKGKKNEKLELKNPAVVGKFVNRALKRKDIHYSQKPHDLLQALFQNNFVFLSADKGLLGNTKNLSITGDGTPVVTGGRTFGKFLCDCRKSGNWKCSCKRRFSDPDADYGWDSSRGKYYYGRSLFMVSASESAYDLPLYPRLYRASKHDSVLFISALHELKYWYPEWKFGECILDSALDTYPIYEMLELYDVSAIIDLNPRRSKQFIHKEMVINLDGVPVCSIGRKLINWGLDKKRYRRKWRCPAKVGKWDCSHSCSNSDYGLTFYTSTTDNPRLFPRVKRDSKEWYKRYSLRTGVERCIKRQKVDYHLEDSKGRSSRHWTIRSYLIAMCQHADAWFKVAKKAQFSIVPKSIKELLAA